MLIDPTFQEIVRRDLLDGQHRNPTDNLDYFTSTFFHRPEELEAEAAEAGFEVRRLMAIEGPTAFLGNLEMFWDSLSARQILLETLRALEGELTLMGVSPHFLVVANR